MKKATEEYKGYIKKKELFLVTLSLLIIFFSIIAISAGSSNMRVSDVFYGLLRIGDEKVINIIYKIRLLRILAAIATGMSLAYAGMVLQTILNNPLASPSTLGINSAAAFGANIGIIVLGFGTANAAIDLGVGFSAFISAIISSLIIIVLARAKAFSRHAILLAGVAMGSFFAAGTTAIQYFAEDNQVASAVFWTFGDLSRMSYSELAILSLAFITFAFFTYLKKWDMNAIDMGEETAHSLGVDVSKFTRNILFTSALITAISVAYVGMIGFIGLIAPQIARRIVGTDKRYMMPATLLIGALVLLIADTIARTIIAPVILPVGSVTSFFGAPLFLFILLKEKK